MSLPALSHLQFAVLSELRPADRPGRDIRDALAALRVRQSGPAFYQMMARLEDAGLLEGWYEQQVVEGQTIKERWYRITRRGRSAWQESRAFYVRMIADEGGEEPVRA
jgi:DNA-binding PadR family transcriptional regulator